jgi:hypothetical protein
METKGLGLLFGVLGGILLVVAALLVLVGGAISVLLGHAALRSLGLATVHFFLDVVVAILMIFFAALGSRHASELALAGGVILVLLAFVTWILIGVGVFELLGGLFALIGGVLLVVGSRR